MSEHSLHRFSITIRTDDLALVGCLQALSQFAQKSGNNRIPWGGTKDSDWQRDGHQVTFRFSADQYREGFLAEARRLLPTSLWEIVGQRDDDPATPRRR
jgi:hypothetical protein